jgi:hypothetical protein
MYVSLLHVTVGHSQSGEHLPEIKKLLPHPRDTHEHALCLRTVGNRVFPLTTSTVFRTPCANVIRSCPTPCYYDKPCNQREILNL